MLPEYLVYLTAAYLEDGATDLALVTVEEGLALTKTNLAKNYEPELLRLKGQILAKRELVAEAESHLRSSLKLAREEKAHLFELRSLVALARFLTERERSREAREVLIEGRASLPEPLFALQEGQAMGELLASLS